MYLKEHHRRGKNKQPKKQKPLQINKSLKTSRIRNADISQKKKKNKTKKQQQKQKHEMLESGKPRVNIPALSYFPTW